MFNVALYSTKVCLSLIQMSIFCLFFILLHQSAMHKDRRNLINVHFATQLKYSSFFLQTFLSSHVYFICKFSVGQRARVYLLRYGIFLSENFLSCILRLFIHYLLELMLHSCFQSLL